MSEEKTNNDFEIKNIPTLKQKPLFTQGQIAEQVQDFIYSYRRGHIKLLRKKEQETIYERVPLTTPQGIAKYYDITKEQYDIRSEYRNTKAKLRNLIQICEGTINATDEERYQKMLELFGLMLTLQTDDRLEGQAIGYDLKRRVDEIENKITGIISRLEPFGEKDF